MNRVKEDDFRELHMVVGNFRRLSHVNRQANRTDPAKPAALNNIAQRSRKNKRKIEVDAEAAS